VDPLHFPERGRREHFGAASVEQKELPRREPGEVERVGRLARGGGTANKIADVA
jgi:hypothetical protein